MSEPDDWSVTERDGFRVGDTVEVLGHRGHIEYFPLGYKTAVIRLKSGGTLSATIRELTRVEWP